MKETQATKAYQLWLHDPVIDEQTKQELEALAGNLVSPGSLVAMTNPLV